MPGLNKCNTCVHRKNKTKVTMYESRPLSLYSGMLPMGVVLPVYFLPGNTFINVNCRAAKIPIIFQACAVTKNRENHTSEITVKNPLLASSFHKAINEPFSSTLVCQN